MAGDDDVLNLLGMGRVYRCDGDDLAHQRDQRRRQILAADCEILARQAAEVDSRGIGGQPAERDADHVAQAQVGAVGVAPLRQDVNLVGVNGVEQQTTQSEQCTAAHTGAGDVGTLIAPRRHDRRAGPGAHHQNGRVALFLRQSGQGLAAAPDSLHLVYADHRTSTDLVGQQPVKSTGDGESPERRQLDPAGGQHRSH